MCRLLGIVSSQPTDFSLTLTQAPRCLAMLSREHRDGWGIAVAGDRGWALHKGTSRAEEDGRFHEVASQSSGRILLSHVRQKTVGPTRLENTHPFMKGDWVFAHNGTIRDIDRVRAGCSRARLEEIAGDTDSEVLFAYLLSAIDADGERGLASAVRALRDAGVGAINFLLSDGLTTFAHRFGRSLFVLVRGTRGSIHPLGELRPRRAAVLVASERITDEPWEEIADGTLLRIDRDPCPSIAREPFAA